MTAVLTPPQALQLGSAKDILICCTVIIHTAMVLSISRQGSGPSFKGLEEGIRALVLFFVKRRSPDKVELWMQGNKLSACLSPWSQQSLRLLWPLGTP